MEYLSTKQNALQYTISYSFIEFTDVIPEELMTYSLPSGYAEVKTDSEQIDATMDEAENMIGFLPLLPNKLPKGYVLEKITTRKNLSAIKLYYNKEEQNNKVVIMQSKTSDQFKSAAGEPTYSIRWQEQRMEYNVWGDTSIEEISMFAESIAKGEVLIPSKEEETTVAPKINVDYDLSIEENDQKSVDAGHSPWRLDPVFVTQVFASLLLSPEGIVGDYPIPYENIEMIENNGTDAIAEIKDKDSIAKYVYLKRLVRQDDTGIWTVMGYDPAK